MSLDWGGYQNINAINEQGNSSDTWNKLGGLLGKHLKGKMIDDKGFFQGGEKGRVFGRARDWLDDRFGWGDDGSEDDLIVNNENDDWSDEIYEFSGGPGETYSLGDEVGVVTGEGSKKSPITEDDEMSAEEEIRKKSVPIIKAGQQDYTFGGKSIPRQRAKDITYFGEGKENYSVPTIKADDITYFGEDDPDYSIPTIKAEDITYWGEGDEDYSIPTIKAGEQDYTFGGKSISTINPADIQYNFGGDSISTINPNDIQYIFGGNSIPRINWDNNSLLNSVNPSDIDNDLLGNNYSWNTGGGQNWRGNY